MNLRLYLVNVILTTALVAAMVSLKYAQVWWQAGISSAACAWIVILKIQNYIKAGQSTRPE